MRSERTRMRSERTRVTSERGRGRDRHVARPGERDCRSCTQRRHHTRVGMRTMARPSPCLEAVGRGGSGLKHVAHYESLSPGVFGGDSVARLHAGESARGRRVGETVQSAAPRSGPRSRRDAGVRCYPRSRNLRVVAVYTYSILIKLCKALQYDRGPTGAEPRPGGESAARNLES